MKVDYNIIDYDEIKNERLREAGVIPAMFRIMLEFGFKSEVDVDNFEEGYEDYFEDTPYASMQDFGNFENYISNKIGDDKFQEIFGDQCSFYDDICKEIREWIITEGIGVTWVPGWNGSYMTMYVIIYKD